MWRLTIWVLFLEEANIFSLATVCGMFLEITKLPFCFLLLWFCQWWEIKLWYLSLCGDRIIVLLYFRTAFLIGKSLFTLRWTVSLSLFIYVICCDKKSVGQNAYTCSPYQQTRTQCPIIYDFPAQVFKVEITLSSAAELGFKGRALEVNYSW